MVSFKFTTLHHLITNKIVLVAENVDSSIIGVVIVKKDDGEQFQILYWIPMLMSCLY